MEGREKVDFIGLEVNGKVSFIMNIFSVVEVKIIREMVFFMKFYFRGY